LTTEFASLDINQTIGLVISISTIIGIAIAGFRWYYKRAYSNGSRDVTEATIHSTLGSKINDIATQINDDKRSILSELDLVETRLTNQIMDKVNDSDRIHKDLEKKFDLHVKDDQSNFKDVNDKISVTHKRIDGVLEDTSYIRGQIDTFLSKSKQ